MNTPPDRAIAFQPEFRNDVRFWAEADRSIALRIVELVEAVMADPLSGPGKPTPLQFALEGCWSRRISQEHRLVYLVEDRRISFLQARYHY